MGMMSDWAIETHNERMESDEEYAAGYEENMRIDAALEAEWFLQEAENEREMDRFDDSRIDYTGYTEQQSAEHPLIDEDLPF